MEHSSAIEFRDRWLARLRADRSIFVGIEAEPEQREVSEPHVAIGITGEEGNYRVAVRVGRFDETTGPLVDEMQKESLGEIDIQQVGDIEGIAIAPRVRPLVAGVSVGNLFGEVGTLGCFVRKKGAVSPRFILSNNHVLARLDFAQPKEVIVQPAASDQTGTGPFEVAEFGEAVRLQLMPAANLVDAAIVPVNSDIDLRPRDLFGIPDRLAGERVLGLREKEPVFKVGRTTQKTTGTIKAWGIGGLQVKLGNRMFEFENQIEVLPDGAQFCDDGDSGSIVLDAANLAVGLLFSKSRLTELAYVNPIDRVFSALGIELA